MSDHLRGPFDPKWLAEYKVSVPCGSVGAASIERYTITEEHAEDTNWHRILHGDDRAPCFPGEYTGITVNGIMVMSDEASEIEDHLAFLQRASGHVLITGLGIGLCLQALLRKPDVTHVTVIEVSSDVLALVAGHYLALFGGERITFVHADAHTWQPAAEACFDAVWHDIWPVAIGAYWPEHRQLRQRYSPFAGWQESWRSDWMERHWQFEQKLFAEGKKVIACSIT